MHEFEQKEGISQPPTKVGWVSRMPSFYLKLMHFNILLKLAEVLDALKIRRPMGLNFIKRCSVTPERSNKCARKGTKALSPPSRHSPEWGMPDGGYVVA